MLKEDVIKRINDCGLVDVVRAEQAEVAAHTTLLW